MSSQHWLLMSRAFRQKDVFIILVVNGRITGKLSLSTQAETLSYPGDYFGGSTFIMRSTSVSVTGRQWKTSGDRSFVGSTTEQEGSISNLWLTARSWAFCNVMNVTEHTWQKDWNVMNMLLWGLSLLKEAKPMGNIKTRWNEMRKRLHCIILRLGTLHQ